MVYNQPWRRWQPKDVAHFLQLCSEELKALWEEIGIRDLSMLDFLEWVATISILTVYHVVTTLAGAASSGWGLHQTRFKYHDCSITIGWPIREAVVVVGGSLGFWVDCAIGSGKDSWMHTLRWANAKSHFIGQGSHFLGSTWSAYQHCLGLSHTGTLAHGTNHCRQRNATVS